MSVDIKKNIYKCSNCGNLFNWGDGCSWHGSYAQLENEPEKVIYCCSEKCQLNVIVPNEEKPKRNKLKIKP